MSAQHKRQTKMVFFSGRRDFGGRPKNAKILAGRRYVARFLDVESLPPDNENPKSSRKKNCPMLLHWKKLTKWGIIMSGRRRFWGQNREISLPRKTKTAEPQRLRKQKRDQFRGFLLGCRAPNSRFPGFFFRPNRKGRKWYLSTRRNCTREKGRQRNTQKSKNRKQ